jgi:hypothetical protein
VAKDAPVYDAGDDLQVKDRRTTHGLELTNEVRDLRKVLATESGRRVLWRLLSKCGLYTLSFAAGQSDVTAFREGRREVGNEILIMLAEADPEAYIRLQKENMDNA